MRGANNADIVAYRSLAYGWLINSSSDIIRNIQGDRLKDILLKNKTILILALCLLAWAAIAAGHYGEAADDESLDTYARQTLEVYGRLFQQGTLVQPEATILDNYGPAFLLVLRMAQLTVENFSLAFDWFSVWHLVSFSGYVAGVVAFYAILTRHFERSVALAATLFFCTQPVLWGQGFVNIKDSPLMAFTVLSFALGMRMARLFPRSSWDFPGWRKSLSEDFGRLAHTSQRNWKRVLLALAVSTGLYLGLKPVLTGAVTSLFSAEASSWLGQQIRLLAPYADSMPISGYVQRILQIVQTPLLVGLLLFAAGTGLAFLRAMPGIRQHMRGYLIDLWTQSWRLWKSPLVWLAALAVGFTTAIRITGPYAALLVVLYLLLLKGPKSLAILPAYTFLSMLFTYLLWPYLWGNPVGNFLEVIRLMSDFPWAGHVLFNGEVIRATRLPADYLPHLLSIQFTLPTLFLLALGIFAVVKKRVVPALGVTAVIWLVLPLLYVIIERPTLYHNFRQFLFITPGIFLLAAYGFHWLRGRTSRPLFVLLSILTLMPSLVALVELHPYEYVYYNEIVGGVQGANGKYEMEYWGTSLTHAMQQLNEIAAHGSVIGSWGNQAIPRRVARPDLQVELLNYNHFDPSLDYKYLLIPLRAARDENFLGQYPNLFSIERLNVPFTRVKELQNFQPDW